ncbi:hypothetical protein D3C80_1988620 [compost metagenome]
MAFPGQKPDQPDILFAKLLRLFGIRNPGCIHHSQITAHMIDQPDIPLVEHINQHVNKPPLEIKLLLSIQPAGILFLHMAFLVYPQ